MSKGHRLVRVYIVTKQDGTKRLVRAKGKTSALGHVVKPEYDVAIASGGDVAELLLGGVALEDVVEADESANEGE